MLRIIYSIFLINIVCYPKREVPSDHPYHKSPKQVHGLLDCPACTDSIYCGDGAGMSLYWSSHIERYNNAYCRNTNS